VLVDAASPGVVLIRTPFGPGWRATLDGTPVPLLPADFVDQGVAVPAGHHVIVVSYVDPSVGRGFLGTVIALVVLLGLAGIAATRTRRRETEDLTASFGQADRPDRPDRVPASNAEP
jgi:MYXO-CTERM domain-containing protein